MGIYGNPLSLACVKTKTLVRLFGRLKVKDSRRRIKPRDLFQAFIMQAKVGQKPFLFLWCGKGMSAHHTVRGVCPRGPGASGRLFTFGAAGHREILETLDAWTKERESRFQLSP